VISSSGLKAAAGDLAAHSGRDVDPGVARHRLGDGAEAQELVAVWQSLPAADRDAEHFSDSYIGLAAGRHGVVAAKPMAAVAARSRRAWWSSCSDTHSDFCAG